jgi:hypothetical protein
VHLLCHLDSPSTTSLPYLGLQEQTGPEFSGLYGSYRVPSRSSLLPLRTLSPGGVAHRPTSLTQSSTAWSQQPTGNTDKGFPKRFSNHRMISRDDFRTGSTHRLAQLFPEQPRILPLEFNTGFSFRKCAHGISQRQTQTPPSLDRGVHGFFRQTQAFFSVSEITQGSLADWLPTRLSLRVVRSNG